MMIETPSQRDPLDQLAESFLARYRAGENPPFTEYTDKYPELAEEIRELFPALVVMEKARPKVVERGEAGALAGEPGALATGGRSEIPSQLGDYRLIREIGRGYMGVVFEAVQESLHRHVALKVLPYHSWVKPTHLERFRREAQAAARLHHTNIVPVFGVGEHEGIHYYAMQFIHGQGLDAVLEEVKRLRNRQEATQNDEASRERKRPDEKSLAFSVAESLVTGRFTSAMTLEAPTMAEGQIQEPRIEDRGLRIEESAGACRSSILDPPSSVHPAPSRSSTFDPPSSVHSELSSQTEFRYFRGVAEIGVQVADALAYAHGQGVLHRDIKPSNLLLDTAGRIWIADFGLAKTEDSEELTNPGDIVGTLRYMSPERFQGRADARSDVYALGITLYEMLTLRPAFGDSNRQQLIQRITDQDPPWPHKLDRKIPRDLETVVLKAIAKEPGKRYATAEKMAEDLRLFLADRPVKARRSSAAEQAWRWYRRNRVVATLAAAALVLLVAVAIISFGAAVWLGHEQANTLEQLHLTQQAEGQATEAKDEATRRLFRSLVGQARASRLSRRMDQRFKTLEILTEAAKMARDLELPNQDFLELRNEVIACLALPDLRVDQELPTFSTACRHDLDDKLERYAVVDGVGKVSVHRVADNSLIATLPPAGPDAWLRFSHDGQFVAVINAQHFKVWKLAGPQPVLLPLEIVHPGNDAYDFSPDDRQLAVGHSDGSIDLHDLNTSNRRQLIKGGARPWHLAFHPTKPQLAVAYSGSVQVRDLATGRILAAFQVGQSNYPAYPWVAWHPEGKVLAAVGGDSNLYLWDVPTKKQIGKLEGCRGGQITLTFNHAGDVLASRGWEGLVRFWDWRTGKQLFSTQAETGIPLRFSPDDQLLGAEVKGTQLRIWEVAAGREYRTLVSDPALGRTMPRGFSVGHEGRLLAVAMDDGLAFWDLETSHSAGFVRLQGIALSAWFDSSGALQTYGANGLLRWPVQADPGARELWRVGPPQKLPIPPAFYGMAQSQDGRIVACAQGWGALVLNLNHPNQLVSLEAHADVRDVAVSPDGQWVATGNWDRPGGGKVWEARGGKPIKDLPVGDSCGVAFSPDGRWLAATGGHRIRLWSVNSWTEGPSIPGPADKKPAFSADSKILAVETGYGVVRLIDPDTGRDYAQLENPDQVRANFIGFSPDGARLIISSGDSLAIHVWDLRAIRRQLAERRLDWNLPACEPPKLTEEVQRLTVEGDLGILSPEREATWQIAKYSLAIALQPINPEAYYQRALAFTSRQQWRPALDDFSLDILLRPNHQDSYVKRAFARFVLGEDFVKTRADLDKALELDPNDPFACNNLAWLYVKGPAELRDPEKGLALAQRAVRRKPDVRHLQNNLGVAYYRLEQWDGAIAALEQAARVNNDEATAFELFFLAMSYHQLGDKEKARESYDRALEWIKSNESALLPHQLRELKVYRSEAEALLGIVPAKSEGK